MDAHFFFRHCRSSEKLTPNCLIIILNLKHDFKISTHAISLSMHRKHQSELVCKTESFAGVKIRRALGPIACKIACGPSKLTLCGPAGPVHFEATVISHQRNTKIWALKILWGPSEYDIKCPNGPWHFLLILTPGHLAHFLSLKWHTGALGVSSHRQNESNGSVVHTDSFFMFLCVYISALLPERMEFELPSFKITVPNNVY